MQIDFSIMSYKNSIGLMFSGSFQIPPQTNSGQLCTNDMAPYSAGINHYYVHRINEWVQMTTMQCSIVITSQ